LTAKEKCQVKLLKKRLDENYLQTQLIKPNENKSEILIRISSLKRKHKRKYKNLKEIYVHQQQVIKLLNTNNRTLILLAKERLTRD